LVYRFLTDRIIAVSEKTKKSLTVGKKSLLKKTTVIYNGVDLSVFNPYRLNDFSKDKLNLNNLNNKIVICVIAVLEKYKGHIYLFHAIKQLKQNGVVNFICLVIGDGREKSNLIEYIKNENLEELILFLGRRKDIPELLKITDILIIPSIEQEAFPRVAIEAMAMKVPVICTDFGGLPEAVINGETGIVVPTKDTEGLYKAIKYLIKNPDIREKMGEKGIKRVKEKFNIEKNMRKTEDLYLEVLRT
jgi:glycosyltransferase involved in cell wall biosynthesis